MAAQQAVMPGVNEGLAEKITGEYAEHLLRQAKLDNLPEDDGSELVILDEACGTGIVSARLMAMLSSKSRQKLDLTMTDISKPIIEYTTRRILRESWQGAKAVQADATDTKLPDACFTHILLSFGPMVIHDWRSAIREIHRMLRPGGVVAMSSWQEGGWLPDVTAALATDTTLPSAPDAHELLNAFSPGSQWDRPEWVTSTLSEEFGFEEIEVNSVARTSVFTGMEEWADTVPMTLGIDDE